MAQEKAALRITELDFLSIRENIKTYLRSQNEFQDFDFDGSGMSILLDILAYNTHYMGYYLNMTANEMFLDTAQIRSSIISLAKSINYIPASRKGSLSRLNIQITPSPSEDQETSSITLEKYTKLIGSDIDGVNYPFVALYSNTSTKSNGSFAFSNVYVKQGEVVTLQFEMQPTNTTRRFEIPSANVDLDTLVITVQESTSNTDTHEYILANDLTEINANSKIYFVEENENLNYTFYFGDDVIGKKPKDGNIVITTYIDSVGEEANNVNNYTFIEPIGGLYSDNVIVNSTVSSYGGVEKETIEQIRFRAPYYYTAQNRAVTINDYKTLLTRDYNYIDAINVWGGEDNDPIIYGKMFASIKTKGNYKLTNLEKERLKNELISSRNIMTVTPEIVDPEYTYILLRGTVTYNPRLTTKTSGELLTLVKAAISDYSETELNDFKATFRKSKLQTYIENSEKSIVGSAIRLFAQKRILIDTTKTRSYEIDFNTPISRSTISDRLSTFPEIEVQDGNNVRRNIFFEEVSSISTGIETIEITAGGSDYRSAPTVTIIGDGSGATATAKVLAGRVVSVTLTNVGKNYTTATISITSSEGSGASAIAKLQANKGTLRSFYYSYNGQKIIVNSNAGTIDFSIGKITINSLRAYDVISNDLYDENYLTISVPIIEDKISVLRNKIVTVDTDDPKSITLEMIAE